VLHARRRIEYFFFSREAAKREEEVHSLTKFVGRAFQSRSPFFTGAGWSRYGAPGYGQGEKFRICWEATVGITVWLAKEPAIGMGVEFRGKTLCIRQLQGVAGANLKEMGPWPRTFVSACLAFAKENGLKRVRLYRADQGLFYRYPDLKPRDGQTYREAVKEHQRRMRRRYDGTARQMRFKMKRRWGEWANPNYARL